MRNSNYARILRMLCVAGAMAAAVAGADGSVTIDFEDTTLAPESFYNGSDYAGSFTSGAMTFPITYVDAGAYTYWSGVALSNMTDRTTAGYANQYSVYTPATPAGNVFGVVNGSERIDLPVPAVVESVDLANTTYAYLSVRDGDWFNDKFGGADGLEEDWFKVIVTGLDAAGQSTGSVELYLADYRPAGTANDSILNAWTSVDLSDLGEISAIAFSWDSSDKGSYGINTPAYVALDNITLSAVPEPGVLSLLTLGAAAALRRRRTH